ncbi:MAG TPA: hypothetical protein VFX76_22585, partial [Roseiflexaceae bacterium]|nr:hypothetical protein [Roseiflexaceae bacterium]
GIALSLCDQATIAWVHGDYALARARCEQADAILVEIGDTLNIGWSRYYLGRLALSTSEISTAIERCTESVTFFRNPEFKPGLASALCTLGKALCHNKQYDEARARLTESLSIRALFRHPQEIAEALEALAQLSIAMDAPARAVRLLGAAQKLRDTAGTPLHPPDRAERDRIIAAARSRLGEDAFEAAWAAGRAMSIDEMVALALAAD